MARNRATAKKAGATFERVIADYLRDTVDDRIDRKVRTGAKDTGDIAGVRHFNERVTIECKNYGGVFHVSTWLAEADVERGNDDGLAGLVIAKRRGITAPGRQVVLMEVDDLVALLVGVRP